MTETVRRRDLRNAPAVVRLDLRGASTGKRDPSPTPYRWNLKHETPVVDEPPVTAYTPRAVALLSLLISAAHLYGLGDYSAKRVGVAFLAFLLGGLLMAVAQLTDRAAVIISLIAGGALLLAAPVLVFWLGA